MTTVRLENWSIGVKSPYSVPESGVSLHGNVYGHPRFEDGHSITTSPIRHVKKDGTVITASGTQYKLGTVDSKYEAEYPNAFSRLMASAEE